MPFTVRHRVQKKGETFILRSCKGAISNKPDHPPTRSAQLLPSLSPLPFAATPRSLIGCPGAEAHTSGAWGGGRAAVAPPPWARPICIPAPTRQRHRSGTRARSGSVAARQWLQLLLLSTRVMVSKLEVMNTSGGRRKIPLGSVRELRQQRSVSRVQDGCAHPRPLVLLGM